MNRIVLVCVWIFAPAALAQVTSTVSAPTINKIKASYVLTAGFKPQFTETQNAGRYINQSLSVSYPLTKKIGLSATQSVLSVDEPIRETVAQDLTLALSGRDLIEYGKFRLGAAAIGRPGTSIDSRDRNLNGRASGRLQPSWTWGKTAAGMRFTFQRSFYESTHSEASGAPNERDRLTQALFANASFLRDFSLEVTAASILVNKYVGPQDSYFLSTVDLDYSLLKAVGLMAGISTLDAQFKDGERQQLAIYTKDVTTGYVGARYAF